MDVGLTASTVKQARDRFGLLYFPNDVNDPKFFERITEAIERVHGIERWVGGEATFAINVATEKTFCLPYFLESIHAALIDDNPGRVKGARYEFMYNGPGRVPATSGIPGTIVDMGVVGIQVPFPSTASVLQVEAVAGSDIGETIRILGYDENEAWITEADGTPGEEVTLAGTAVLTTNQFSAVKGIQKLVTAGRVVVNHNGTGTELASIEGSHVNPYYRCYRVLDSSATTITALCKRRPVPVRRDEDYIFPGNLPALKMLLQALDFEEASEIDRAQQYFRMAVEILNGESATYKGSAEESLNFEIWGSGISGIGTTY